MTDSLVTRSKAATSQLDLFRLVLIITHAIVGLFLGVRGLYHVVQIHLYSMWSYPNNTPQIIRRDVSKLEKLPRHIAVVLKLKDDDKALETLFEEAGNIAAWCLGAGTQELTIYEKTGALKEVEPKKALRMLSGKVSRYFGNTTDTSKAPKLEINIPREGRVAAREEGGSDSGASLCINLVSCEDGREAIVDLSKTLAEMATRHEVHGSELTTAKIDVELKSATFDEPDLVILFSPEIDLQGFPPWQIRLSEIFYLKDNNSLVTYYVFYKALEKFSTCKINVGK